MYDCIIVGAGIAGSVVARQFADAGKKVVILEKRNHIGGNCFDCKDEQGILIHQYGPHIFHTNEREVYEYLSGFTKWYDYHHEVLAYVNGEYIPVPFNLNTLKLAFGEEQGAVLEEKLLACYGAGSRVAIMELRKNPDKDIQKIADYVYENIFLKYTMKQWGQTPEEIDPGVTARVPVVLTKRNGYFQDTYQGMPFEGYTPMFEKMLNHENIEVRLGVDARECLTFEEHTGTIHFDGEVFHNIVVYTGAIDELFDVKFGRLPYRTLDFVFEQKKEESFQPAAVVNYTVSEEYTRITEFKKLTGQESPVTTIVKEYSKPYTGEDGQIPYYAIANQENDMLYTKYLSEAKKYKNLYMLGRLAEYKYYNIDAITKRALELSDELLRR